MLDDDALLEGFEQGTIPAADFHHAEHVRVAWMYLRRYPLPDALPRFVASLKRFAAGHGVPGLYHETITVAFVLIIAERLGDARELSWTDFAASNPDLLIWKPSVLADVLLRGDVGFRACAPILRHARSDRASS